MNEHTTEILVVGGGPAGIFTSQGFVAAGITDFRVVCDEPDVVCRCNLPYGIGKTFLPSLDTAKKSHYAFLPNFDQVGIMGRIDRIDHQERVAEGKVKSTGERFRVNYKKLVLAMGAQASLPPIRGVLRPEGEAFTPRGEVVFYDGKTYDKGRLRDEVIVVRSYADGKHIEKICEDNDRIAVIGSGLVGLEIVDNIIERGKKVTLVEILPHVVSSLDPEMAAILESGLREAGVELLLGNACTEVRDGKIVVGDREVPIDLVVIGAGASPDVDLARQVGCDIGTFGVKVDGRCHTSVPDVWALGDLVELEDALFGRPQLLQLLPNVMIQGVLIGRELTGEDIVGPPVVASGISHMRDYFWGTAGYSAQQAEKAGLRTVSEKLDLFTAEHASPFARKAWYKMVVAAETKGAVRRGQIVGFQAITEGKHIGDLMARWCDIVGGMETVDDLPRHNWIHQPMVGDPMSNAYIMQFFNKLKGRLATAEVH